MELRWHPITGPAGQGPRDALYVGGTEVARMHERLTGGWFAELRYPHRGSTIRQCTSYEAGRAGCEVWAGRHYAVLAAHDERRHLEWLAQQTWRGEACMEARERLVGMGVASGPRIPAEARAAG